MITSNPKVTICIPVYNGEKTIEKTIQSILSQTYDDFILLISDNASSDQTSNISKKFEAKDPRIKYFKQPHLISVWNNFDFLLRKTTTTYFMWLAADDLIHPDFIKKTLSVLESNKKTVGCFTKYNYLKLYDNTSHAMTGKENWNIFSRLGSILHDSKFVSVTGSYNLRTRKGLFSGAILIYSMFRTDIAKKCFIVEPSGMKEHFFLMRVYRFGEVSILNEILFDCYVGGLSSSGPFNNLKTDNSKLIDYIFPRFKFNLFFLKKFGLIQFLKNLDYFFRSSLFDSIYILYDFFKNIKSNTL